MRTAEPSIHGLVLVIGMASYELELYLQRGSSEWWTAPSPRS